MATYLEKAVYVKGEVPFFMQAVRKGSGPSASELIRAHLVFKVRSSIHLNAFTRVLQVRIVPDHKREEAECSKGQREYDSTALTST
jgi:hypothetical protein